MNETISLNLDYANARKLLLPTANQISLVLVGCGGTGSFLARNVAQVARLLMDRFHKEVSVFMVDPDRVEEKNIYRQNFCPAEIGKYKAECVAFRYGMAWGIDIAAVNSVFYGPMFANLSGLTVLIGCVDNAEARKSLMSNSSRRSTWWLDCGNSKASGQVLLGCGTTNSRNPFELDGYCTWLPMPTDQHPELLEALPEELVDTSRMSCAEMALVNSQGLTVNNIIASHAGDFLVRMLLTNDLRKMATYIDLESGSTRSKYIVPENVSMETARNEK